MRAYKAELLDKAIAAAKNGTEPIELLLKDGSDFRLVRIEKRCRPQVHRPWTK